MIPIDNEDEEFNQMIEQLKLQHKAWRKKDLNVLHNELLTNPKFKEKAIELLPELIIHAFSTNNTFAFIRAILCQVIENPSFVFKPKDSDLIYHRSQQDLDTSKKLRTELKDLIDPATLPKLHQ